MKTSPVRASENALLFNVSRAAKRVLFCLSVAVLSSTSLAAEAGKSISLTTLQWEPYVGEQLVDKGYAHELVAQAFAAADYEMQADFYPWARALRVATKGKAASGLFPEYFSESRQQDFLYSDPFPGGPIALYKRKADDIFFLAHPEKQLDGALKHLAGYKFGVVRGYINTVEIDTADYLTRLEAKSDTQNLKKLQHERVDLAVIDPYVARYIIDTQLPEYASTLEPMNPPLEYKSLYVVFSRNDPKHEEYAAAFNSGLAKLRENGALEVLLRRYGFVELAERVAKGL